MSDPHQPEPTPSAPQVEFTVDLGAFLPETSALGPVDEAHEDEPHDEARDEEARVPDLVAQAPDVAPTPDHAPEAVDVAVLAGIEADLAAVDHALEAIDAGEPSRSPLLTELLADPPPT